MATIEELAKRLESVEFDMRELKRKGWAEVVATCREARHKNASPLLRRRTSLPTPSWFNTPTGARTSFSSSAYWRRKAHALSSSRLPPAWHPVRRSAQTLGGS